MKENTEIQKEESSESMESFKIAELPTHIRLLGKNELNLNYYNFEFNSKKRM